MKVGEKEELLSVGMRQGPGRTEGGRVRELK